VDLTWDPATRRVTAARIHPPAELQAGATYEGTVVRPSPEMAAVIAPAIERAAKLRNEPLGVTVEKPIAAKYQQESALGNLVASLMLDLDPRADVAITNAGGLRADLPEAPLTYGSLYDALPFDNRPARARMTGRDLAAMFRQNLMGSGGILSISGARVEARCTESGPVVQLFREDRTGRRGKRIQDDERLTVVTNEFLATGGDKAGGFRDVEIDEMAPPIRDSIAGLLKKRRGVLRPEDWLRPNEPRIRLVPGRQIPFCRV
jgi:5'-nucleotidase